jgi:hypothetical protein
MISRSVSTLVVGTALATLFLVALELALAQGRLHALALDIPVILFAVTLSVFVVERIVVRREERRWVSAKKWLYLVLLEAIDDLLKQLLPATVPKEDDVEIAVYVMASKRIQFGEVAAYGLLRLLVSPDDREMQSHILWHARESEPPRFVRLAREALSDAREQIRDTFDSSAQLLDADITTMLMNFEQAILAAIRHLDAAITMREEKLEEVAHLDDEETARQRTSEADHDLAFAASIIVESVVNSAMKPKAWLEDQVYRQTGESPFEYLEANDLRK